MDQSNTPNQIRIFFSVFLLFFTTSVYPATAQDLPQQTGAINDYAAVLGGKPQREPLQNFIDQLQEKHQVSLILLFSERDPFNDPQRYAAEIRQAWNIDGSRIIFGMFLEDTPRWSLHLWAGTALQSHLPSEVRINLEKQINTAAQRGRIRPASQQLGQTLLDLFEKGVVSPKPEESDGNWFTPTAFTFSGLMMFWGFLRWARSYCPHCVKRLHEARRGGKKLRHCPNCGYNR